MSERTQATRIISDSAEIAYFALSRLQKFAPHPSALADTGLMLSDNLAPLLPCHPRDLISIAADLAVYDGQPRRINKARMRRDRPSYFVSTNTGGTVRHKLSPDRGYKSC